MVTPRSHCHFLMQARALRVPEFCDDHTPPSCSVSNSLVKPGRRSVNTSVLPDPWLTQEGPVTFLACALNKLFVRSCDLAHHGLHGSRVCVCSHHSSLQDLPFRCLPLLSSRAPMDEPQCMRLPLGTSEWNHSYNTANPLSALHSLHQLQAGASSPSPVQMSASTRESHDAAPSSSVSCSQATLSATHSQVRMVPTRTTPNDLLSATLAEAATQLSFAAFLECCILVDASPPPQLPVPTPSLDAATQTFSHTTASQDVSAQLSFREFLVPPSTLDVRCPACARSVPSLHLDAAVQTPLHSVATYDSSTQLPLTEFFIGCILSNDPLDRQALQSAHCSSGSASPPQPPDIASRCSPSNASHASDGHEHTTAPHVLLEPSPGLEKHARQYASHGKPVKAAPVRPRLCTPISVASHSHMSVPPKWDDILCAQLRPTREVHVPPLREPTILSVQILVQGLALVLPMVNFGQSNLDGLGCIDTVDNDLVHHQYGLSVPQWNPGLARRHLHQFYRGGLWKVPCDYPSRSQ